MKIIRVTLAGLYVIVAKALASSALKGDAGLQVVKGTAITCKDKVEVITSNVSQPNTIVEVTCPRNSSLNPEVPDDTGNNVCFDEQCNEKGVLSSVCPGATVSKQGNREDGTTVDVYFPQLPATKRVVYLQCTKISSGVCTAMIAVAPASPQGPQACAVPGTSVTLQVNEAGGSAQFACGGELTLAPSDSAKAYADDCSKVETLKDMTRSDKTGEYSTLKVNKLRKKKLCYLCEQSKAPGKLSGEGNRCTVYVEVSGTRRFSSSVFFGFTLACVAAVLGFS